MCFVLLSKVLPEKNQSEVKGVYGSQPRMACVGRDGSALTVREDTELCVGTRHRGGEELRTAQQGWEHSGVIQVPRTEGPDRAEETLRMHRGDSWVCSEALGLQPCLEARRTFAGVLAIP